MTSKTTADDYPWLIKKAYFKMLLQVGGGVIWTLKGGWLLASTGCTAQLYFILPVRSLM